MQVPIRIFDVGDQIANCPFKVRQANIRSNTAYKEAVNLARSCPRACDLIEFGSGTLEQRLTYFSLQNLVERRTTNRVGQLIVAIVGREISDGHCTTRGRAFGYPNLVVV